MGGLVVIVTLDDGLRCAEYVPREWLLLWGLHDSCSNARVQLTSQRCAAEAHAGIPFSNTDTGPRPRLTGVCWTEERRSEARLRDVAYHKENIPRRAHAASSAPRANS